MTFKCISLHVKTCNTDCVKMCVFILTPMFDSLGQTVQTNYDDPPPKSARSALSTATMWYLPWRADSPESFSFQKPGSISASADQVPFLTWKRKPEGQM